MEGDELLRTNERSKAMFGKGLFFITILGRSETSPTARWQRQKPIKTTEPPGHSD